MLDCGLHMGSSNHLYPNFAAIPGVGSVTEKVDALIISHFHLDHCGALPFFTQVVGYKGPVFMTQPTKQLTHILIQDYIKVANSSGQGDPRAVTSSQIDQCLKNVTSLQLHQTFKLSNSKGLDISITPYYAGHVLGAAMFYITVGSASFLYTGDYNMVPDRHLGNAWVPQLAPDLLITETTYATTLRDSKRSREHLFLNAVRNCVIAGGKVLIPVFALGRAQEMCILLEAFWDRLGLKVPVYFSSNLTKKANQYYSLFTTWTNQTVQQSERDLFQFQHISQYDRKTVDIHGPHPMVIFATPGMLHTGTSLQIFKSWASDPKNLVILPGYCVVGTFGNTLLSNSHLSDQILKIGPNEQVKVSCKVRQMSFSAHADRAGILQLIDRVKPRQIALVHGEYSRMSDLQKTISKTLHIPCHCPANGEFLSCNVQKALVVGIAPKILYRSLSIPHHDKMMAPYGVAAIEYPNTHGQITHSVMPKIVSALLAISDETPQFSTYEVLSRHPKTTRGHLDAHLVIDPRTSTYTIEDSSSLHNDVQFQDTIVCLPQDDNLLKTILSVFNDSVHQTIQQWHIDRMEEFSRHDKLDSMVLNASLSASFTSKNSEPKAKKKRTVSSQSITPVTPQLHDVSSHEIVSDHCGSPNLPHVGHDLKSLIYLPHLVSNQSVSLHHQILYFISRIVAPWIHPFKFHFHPESNSLSLKSIRIEPFLKDQPIVPHFSSIITKRRLNDSIPILYLSWKIEDRDLGEGIASMIRSCFK